MPLTNIIIDEFQGSIAHGILEPLPQVLGGSVALPASAGGVDF